MGVNLKNCPKCGRVFAMTGRDLCQKCLELEDDDYAIVRRYVRDHPRSTVIEVAEETGVSEDIILQYLKDGRLVSNAFSEVITCERCGKSIRGGKYCESCKNVINAQLRGVDPPKEEEPKSKSLGKNANKMHSKNNIF